MSEEEKAFMQIMKVILSWNMKVSKEDYERYTRIKQREEEK